MVLLIYPVFFILLFVLELFRRDCRNNERLVVIDIRPLETLIAC